MDFRTKKVNILIVQIFFILLFASCKEAIRPLQLSDLKFEQVDEYQLIYNDKEILSANKIDTMFMILDPNSGTESYSRSWYNGALHWTGTIGYYVYDKNGRILETQLFGWDYPSNKYQYDSVGLLKEYLHESDYRDRQKIRHRFVPDSLLLYQYRYYDLKSNPAYEILFKFDKRGNVLEEKAGWTDEDFRHKTIYEYNQSGKLIYTQSARYENDKEEEDTHRYRHYFYTNDKLDSVYNVLPIYINPGKRLIKLYYDERGLCYRQDRYGVITNCIYKQRERDDTYKKEENNRVQKTINK